MDILVYMIVLCIAVIIFLYMKVDKIAPKNDSFNVIGNSVHYDEKLDNIQLLQMLNRIIKKSYKR